MNDRERNEAIIETIETFGREGKPVRVERFDPAPGRAMATVLLLHGADGLRYCGPSYREMARDLARNGFLGLLVHYFDSTGNVAASPFHFLRWIQVVEDAVDYAVRQPATAGRSVGVVGFSLGAYLALAVASQDSRVGAVVDCFGGVPDLLAANVRTMPPVLILHGEADAVVPVEEAHKLERLLRERGLPCETHLFPGQDHNFRGVAAAEAFQLALAFLEQHLLHSLTRLRPPR
jgi:carboxymethylenebutenolidase